MLAVKFIYCYSLFPVMKRMSFIILLVGLSLLVASCNTKYVCVDGSTVANPEACPTVPEPSAEVISAEIEQLLSKSKNVESMSYDYKRVEKPLERPVNVWIKKLIVKQELIVQTDVINKNVMDTIIFDTAAHTANAYCESRNYCLKTGDAGTVDYDQYYIKTPLDWIDGITSAEKISEAKIGDRTVWQLRTKDGVSLWVDTYYGVPLRVDFGSERHEFQNPLFNSVRDQDVQFMEI